MLHEFLARNRNELIERCQKKAAERIDRSDMPMFSEHGVPLFLDQLADTLRKEQSTPKGSAAERALAPSQSEIGLAAAIHGAELLRFGFTIDQVVHEYGDICQSVTELAVEEDVAICTNEFRILNRCLDDAIADAVTSFGLARQVVINDRAEDLQSCLYTFTEEHRRLVDSAIQSYSAIKTGKVGLTGSTGSLLDHTLSELRYLTERTLPEIRLASAVVTISVN
jgi:hypothetical protein